MSKDAASQEEKKVDLASEKELNQTEEQVSGEVEETNQEQDQSQEVVNGEQAEKSEPSVKPESVDISAEEETSAKDPEGAASNKELDTTEVDDSTVEESAEEKADTSIIAEEADADIEPVEETPEADVKTEAVKAQQEKDDSSPDTPVEAEAKPTETSAAEENTESAAKKEISETEPSAEEVKANQQAEEEEHDKLLKADYETYSKEELLATIEKLTKMNDFSKIDTVLNIINPIFLKITNKEKEDARKKFLEEGGTKEDFVYKDIVREKFDASFRLLKDKKHKHFDELGKQKQVNYEHALELLEKLRLLVDGEESTTSISAIKDIQAEWKALGHVPSQHVRPLWASYNALMDRFYDHRSIYFELKELDRKKNLTAKLHLCERAEALEKEENLKTAIKELNELHNEFKHIGPVPKEEQESLWTRFKSASDKIYTRRKSFYEDLKKDLEANYVEKDKLRLEVEPFAGFDSDRIVEWNKKTQEILDIQKRWEKIGGLPKEKAAQINKPFWSAFKKFFNNKNNFFKQLEGQREENYKLKEELVVKAEEFKDSSDWNQTATKLKQLQQEWRNIGPVPEKKRNELYTKFKAACDQFFENRRNRFKEEEKEYEVNLKKKNEIADKILDLAKKGESDIKALESLQEEWNSIGFVPKSDIKSSQHNFSNAVDTFIDALDIDEHEKQKYKIATELTSLKGTPNANRKLNKKEFTLRKQISNLENDITLWNNNLEFFANSKNANQLREEFEKKIENARLELEALKEQLKIIKEI